MVNLVMRKKLKLGRWNKDTAPPPNLYPSVKKMYKGMIKSTLEDGVDEDTFRAVVEIVNEQYVLSKMAHDRASIEFYSYLLGELESVEDVGEDDVNKPDVDIKLGKLERYLRMLQ